MSIPASTDGSAAASIIKSTSPISSKSSLTTAFMVADLSRSIAYVFPSILIAILYLVKTEKIKSVTQIMISVMLCCVLFPSQNFALSANGGESWILPIFYKMLNHII